MARPLRIAFPGAFFHVTARGNEHKAVFKSRRDREQFVDKGYESPLKDVFGSVRLGSQAFIDYIKKEFIPSRKSDRNVPALKPLASQATIPDICQALESVLCETLRLSRERFRFSCVANTQASALP